MRPVVVKVAKSVGSFAENKDAAANIREETLIPSLTRGCKVSLDFESVEYATQSFIHALLAKAIREDSEWLESILFKNCSDAVRGIIEIVVDYAQEVD